ncbi:MAG: hypothetical protein WBQ34_18680 [Candidatus Acidiferrales bacterium]
MTSRFIYRILICLHPSNFREQHGDEMLCIFDESAPLDTSRLLADASLSLARQWFFHSAWWKFAAGAAVSSLLVLACGYSASQSFRWSLLWGAQRQADLLPLYGPPDPSFNEFEFEREAQQAVRMLAFYRREARNGRDYRAGRGPNAPNRYAPALPDSENRD